jgi:hypothetical protein
LRQPFGQGLVVTAEMRGVGPLKKRGNEMKNIIVINLLLLFIFSGCSQSTAPDENPAWVTNLIEKYQSEPVGNPPQSIWQYDYKGETVFYIPPQCCDQFSALYDANGNTICAPGGGITGSGDGHCSDFFQLRKNEKLIWQDTRKR